MTAETGARLTIDLGALAHNHAVLLKQAQGAELAPVVKADGYGLGVGPVARRLHESGARTFYVARVAEGEALRRELGGREARIYVFDGAVGDLARFEAAKLTPVLTSAEQAKRWTGPCALHVDTGMNRIGVSIEEAETLAHSGRRPDLILSHLGRAAEPDHPRNASQLERFRQAIAAFPGVPASLAASAGMHLSPDYLFDQVRPGISLYGGGPLEVSDARLRAVATLTAPILQIRDLRAGEAVGYGAMFTAPAPMRIALAAAGYADGVLRTAHGKTSGFVGGQRRAVVAITMDLIALDVSEGQAALGDEVEFLGPNIQLDDLAAAAGSVAHECLVRLSARAERIYLG